MRGHRYFDLSEYVAALKLTMDTPVEAVASALRGKSFS